MNQKVPYSVLVVINLDSLFDDFMAPRNTIFARGFAYYWGACVERQVKRIALTQQPASEARDFLRSLGIEISDEDLVSMDDLRKEVAPRAAAIRVRLQGVDFIPDARKLLVTTEGSNDFLLACDFGLTTYLVNPTGSWTNPP